jgi:hypothetical protein
MSGGTVRLHRLQQWPPSPEPLQAMEPGITVTVTRMVTLMDRDCRELLYSTILPMSVSRGMTCSENASTLHYFVSELF